MPELPEVETTLRGIKDPIIQQKILDIIIRHPQLRWPIPGHLSATLKGHTLQNIERRSKYLLFRFAHGTLILHLGMSGRLHLLSQPVPPQKHDHIDIIFANQIYLRFTDPRRFGAVLWTTEDPDQHALLKHIGPEPLSPAFHGEYLWKRARGRKVPVKSFIMDGKTVAGVGNIYATEALFLARIHPTKPAGKISLADYQHLAAAIQTILKKAIKQGGTTLKDFKKPTGMPGYFQMALQVYGRAGKPCPRCHTALKLLRLGQRSTVYCPACQKR